jgi:Ca2+-binding EF-hand superfamily protein
MIDTTNMSIMANYIQPSSTNMSTHMISQKDSDFDELLNMDELGVSSDIFSAYDSDESGLISKSELTSAIDTAMSQFDGGMPSKDEFQSVLSQFGFEAQNIQTGSNSLSSSQANTISSVLENYDANNLSESDAQEIVAAFKEAGIEPESELESAMEEAGFDAHEVGTLAGVGAQGQGAGGGGGQGGGESSSSEEEYDVMDTNQDGTVSFEEMQEYYGTSSDSSTENLSQNNQNALENLQLLMQTIKSSSSDSESLDTSSFNSLLKTINNQNNNNDINTYLQNSSSSSMFGYV